MPRLRPLLSAAKSALIRRPREELARLQRWGPRAYLRCGAWARQMERAAMALPPIVPAEPQPNQIARPLEVWFLTGDRFWYQTAFCAWSLAKQASRSLVLNLVDDGTLRTKQEQQLRHLFPRGMTRWHEELNASVAELLPLERFPVLRQRWLDYIHIRKLIAVHLNSHGSKLVLDSDMLFFQPPLELLAWWDQPVGPCLMLDCLESYGYSRPLLEKLAGAPIPPQLNVGICGLASDSIDWPELEHWCRILLEEEGSSYYLEQALVAMLAARNTPTVLPGNRYITFPTEAQSRRGDGVLQHYVADSKPRYFRAAWRQALPA